MAPHHIHTGHSALPQWVKKKKNCMKLEEVVRIGKELEGRERGWGSWFWSKHMIYVYMTFLRTPTTKQSKTKRTATTKDQGPYNSSGCITREVVGNANFHLYPRALEPTQVHPRGHPQCWGLKPNTMVALRGHCSIWLGNERGFVRTLENEANGLKRMQFHK